MTTPVVLCEGLTRVFQMPAETIHALRGVDLNIEAGEFVALMGPSGSGKSTLLHILGTMDRPTAGRCEIAGADVTRLGEEGRRRLRRDRIGFIFQEFHLVPTLTVAENIALPGLFGGAPVRREGLQELLTAVDLADRAQHLPRELSGGQRQRVAIARALVHQPMLLLADEPTGNLDSATGLELMQLFRQLCSERNVTICMVTHDRLMAAEADRIIQMRDGQIVIEGAVPARAA